MKKIILSLCLLAFLLIGTFTVSASSTGHDEYYEIKNSDYVSIILSRYKQGDTLKLVIQYKDGVKEHVVFNG